MTDTLIELLHELGEHKKAVRHLEARIDALVWEARSSKPVPNTHTAMVEAMQTSNVDRAQLAALDAKSAKERDIEILTVHIEAALAVATGVCDLAHELAGLGLTVGRYSDHVRLYGARLRRSDKGRWVDDTASGLKHKDIASWAAAVAVLKGVRP